MKIEQAVSLKDHSTMRLGGEAKYLVNVTSTNELVEAVDWAVKSNECVMAVGKGSNIIWGDEGFDGLVVVMDIKGIEKIDDRTLKFAAGEVWDHAVEYSTELGLSGIETLSLIPGTCGATPIQNVGAYGSEVKDTLIELEAYDLQELTMVTIPNEECEFGYRTSRFKTHDKGRFIITSVTFRLSQQSMEPPFYAALEKYLFENNITDYSPASLRQAVIAIRSSKLPDPDKVANNGSFFANPIVDQMVYEKIKSDYPDAPGWPTNDGKVKLAAGWLVDKAGFRGMHDEATGMSTWQHQALVLVNDKAQTTADLISFRDKIVAAVEDKFGVRLEQEPELVQ